MSLRDVSENFDWEHYIECNFEYKKAGHEYRIPCVNCGETGKKLYINPEKGMFNCFKCDFRTGKEYSVFDFVALAEGISKANAIEQLKASYRETTPQDPMELLEAKIALKTAGIRSIEGLPKPALPLSFEEHNEASEYLKRRGLLEEDFLATQMHYVPDGYFPVYSKGKYKGNLRNRIIYPIYGGNKDMVSWQSRTIDPKLKNGKYLSCPDSDLMKTVWPYVPSRGKTAVIVEGVFDALAVRRAGFSAYATFTKHVTDDQLATLRFFGVENIILFYDKSDAKEQMIKIIDTKAKSHFTKVYVPDFEAVNWPSSLDAGDCLALSAGTKQLQDLLNSLVDVYSIDYVKWQICG